MTINRLTAMAAALTIFAAGDEKSGSHCTFSPLFALGSSPTRCRKTSCRLGLRVSKPEELRGVLERGLNTPGVVVIDVVVSEEENVFPMVPAGAGLKEIKLS